MTLHCRHCTDTIHCTCTAQDGGNCLCAEYSLGPEAVCLQCARQILSLPPFRSELLAPNKQNPPYSVNLDGTAAAL